MEAILKNNFKNILAGYEQVADITVSTATTSVDFTGLSIGKEDDYKLVSTVINGTSTNGVKLGLYFNSNVTDTNYYNQRLYASSTAYGGTRSNNNTLLYVDSYSKSFCIDDIKLTNNEYIVQQISLTEKFDTSVPILNNYADTSTFTLTSITSLKVQASITNAIGIGSRFQLYKRVAPIIADIEVTSDTTSVDITGLSIDKDSEYMLVSDIVNGTTVNEYYLLANNNLTLTNYYMQELVAFGTGVASARGNTSKFSFVASSGKSFSITNIKLTNNGYFTFQSNVNRDIGSGIILDKFYGTSTFTMTSITSLRISSATSAIGSRFQLIKLK